MSNPPKIPNILKCDKERVSDCAKCEGKNDCNKCYTYDAGKYIMCRNGITTKKGKDCSNRSRIFRDIKLWNKEFCNNIVDTIQQMIERAKKLKGDKRVRYQKAIYTLLTKLKKYNSSGKEESEIGNAKATSTDKDIIKGIGKNNRTLQETVKKIMDNVDKESVEMSSAARKSAAKELDKTSKKAHAAAKNLLTATDVKLSLKRSASDDAELENAFKELLLKQGGGIKRKTRRRKRKKRRKSRKRRKTRRKKKRKRRRTRKQ